ncbi:MAG: hypothetical protein FJX76_07355 [Armatimonadetes bacterium]|nr:hypothetical protein [Armatimonadota bacterium]
MGAVAEEVSVFASEEAYNQHQRAENERAQGFGKRVLRKLCKDESPVFAAQFFVPAMLPGAPIEARAFISGIVRETTRKSGIGNGAA